MSAVEHSDAEGSCRLCGAPAGAGDWCPRCLTRFDAPDPHPAEWIEEARARRRPEHRLSRVRGGPMTFGPIGRILLSIVPVVVAFVAARNIFRARHDASFAYYLVLGVPLIVLVALFLAAVWKRDRIA